MIKCAVVFSKENGMVLLASTFDELDPLSESFSERLDKIKEVGKQLEKGMFNQKFDSVSALIFAFKRIGVALVFDSSIEETKLLDWEPVAKEIASDVDKIYDPSFTSNEKYFDYKKRLDEIVQWHIKEHSPIDKMKEALW